MPGSQEYAERRLTFRFRMSEGHLKRALAAFTEQHGSEDAVLEHLPAFASRWLPGCRVTVVRAETREPPPLAGLEPCFTLPAWNGDPHRVYARTQGRGGLLTERHAPRIAIIERRLSQHLRALRDEAAAVPHEAWRRLRLAERRIEAAGSVPQLKTAVARYARAACSADAAVVLIRRGDRLLRAAHVGRLQHQDALVSASGLPLAGALARAWRHGRTVHWTAGDGELDVPGVTGLQAYALLPLRYEETEMEALVLVMFDRFAHVWTAEERRRLHVAAKIAEIMLERLLLRRRNDALSSMVGRLGAAESPADVVAQLEASLRSFRPGTGRLTVWWRVEGGFSSSEPGSQAPRIAAGTVTAGELAERYGAPTSAFTGETTTLLEAGGRRMVVLPLSFGGRTPAVGILEEKMHGTTLDRGNLAVLEVYARQAGLLIFQQSRGAEWQTLAHRDALTGLPNRLSFDQAFAHAAQRSVAAGVPLALLLMDVNRFKRVNDELGHAAGDALLKAAGPVLVAALGSDGVLHRWAGDEFAALMPGASLEEVTGAVARLKEAFAPLAPLPGVGLAVGTARYPEVPTGELLLAADADLYGDKPAGMPRVDG